MERVTMARPPNPAPVTVDVPPATPLVADKLALLIKIVAGIGALVPIVTAVVASLPSAPLARTVTESAEVNAAALPLIDELPLSVVIVMDAAPIAFASAEPNRVCALPSVSRNMVNGSNFWNPATFSVTPLFI